MDREKLRQGDKLLKAIRHSGARMYKSLTAKVILEEVRRLRDLCDELLAMWGEQR